MELLRKQKLMDIFFTDVTNQYNEDIIKYSRKFGCKENDVFNCIDFLSKLQDTLYCGEGVNERANFYLYNHSNILWFVNEVDMFDFLFNEVNTLIPIDISINMYRGYYLNGYWLLKAEDVVDGEIVIELKKGIFCENRNLMFSNEIEIVDWLSVLLGKEKKTVIRQLEKNLNGETNTCYGFSFKRI